jgi:hypothetical protein
VQTPANEVFKGKRLKLYGKCRILYPGILESLGFEAEIVCYFDADKTPSHFLVKAEQYGIILECFTSLYLSEFYAKLLLLKNTRDNAKSNNIDIEESVNLLREKDGRYIVIQNDIEELENISKFGSISDNSDASIEIMPPSVMFH